MTTYKIRPLNWICYRRGSYVEHLAFGAFDTIYGIAQSKMKHTLRIESYGELIEKIVSQDYEALKQRAKQHCIDSLVAKWLKPTDDEGVYEVKPLQWRETGYCIKAPGIDVDMPRSVIYYIIPPTEFNPLYTLAAEGAVPEAGFEPLKWEDDYLHTAKKRAFQHHKEMLLKYFLYENLEWERWGCQDNCWTTSTPSNGYEYWIDKYYPDVYEARIYTAYGSQKALLKDKTVSTLEEAQDFCFHYHNHLLGLPQ